MSRISISTIIDNHRRHINEQDMVLLKAINEAKDEYKLFIYEIYLNKKSVETEHSMMRNGRFSDALNIKLKTMLAIHKLKQLSINNKEK